MDHLLPSRHYEQRTTKGNLQISNFEFEFQISNFTSRLALSRPGSTMPPVERQASAVPRMLTCRETHISIGVDTL
jgi:hypothetical protein